jgi:hypothetical protein
MTSDIPDAGELSRESGRIGEFLTEWLAGKITDESRLWISDDFTPLCIEEARVLGYADDDPVILLRRKSDGVIFEVEIEAAVRRAGTQVRAAP